MANFENITIEKGMYQQKGKTLTDVLETLDPSENYKGTALSNLDAFSRQLKRFDIKVNGSGSDCVENFPILGLGGTFSRICQPCGKTGYGESGYSPADCGYRYKY